MTKPMILIVEDDAPVRNLMATTLRAGGYRFIEAENGANALMRAASHAPDVILLDLGLPDMDGVEVIRRIRSWSQTPIIVISARSEESDKISALDEGADDYLTKPFSVEELLARIRVMQRRQAAISAQERDEPVFKNGSLSIDFSAGCVYRDQELLHLTPIEYKLLCLLARNCGKVLTHTYIMERVWGSCLESDVASLRVFMATLRRKIGDKGSAQPLIQTHVGIGYRMVRAD